MCRLWNWSSVLICYARGASRLTLATFTSVAASVTTVGCITLCTARLNIGSIRFPLAVDPPAVLFAPELLAETPETFDLRDSIRLMGIEAVLLVLITFSSLLAVV
jgi:hypothetical protein